MELQDRVLLLETQLDSLKPRDRSFAEDLIKYYKWHGGLSEKQTPWIQTLLDRAMGFDGKPEIKTESVGDFQPVMALFDHAKKHLKYPSFRVTFMGQDLALSLSGPASKAPGYVNVTDGKPFGENVWFGRVSPKGVWEPNARLPEEQLKPARRFLNEFASNPAAVAAKYGKLAGRCCFCSLPLSDKKSTAAGFGRTCAKHFGLEEEWKSAVAVLKEE